MKVFITGIAGFLGSHLADHFLSMGWDVSGVDNLVGGYKSNVPTAAKFYNEGMDDVERLAELVRDVDVVYPQLALRMKGCQFFHHH